MMRIRQWAAEVERQRTMPQPPKPILREFQITVRFTAYSRAEALTKARGIRDQGLMVAPELKVYREMQEVEPESA